MLPIQTVFQDIEDYTFKTTGSRTKVTLTSSSEVQIARAKLSNITNPTSRDLPYIDGYPLSSTQPDDVLPFNENLDITRPHIRSVEPICEASNYTRYKIPSERVHSLNSPGLEVQNNWVEAAPNEVSLITSRRLATYSKIKKDDLTPALSTSQPSENSPGHGVEPESERLSVARPEARSKGSIWKSPFEPLSVIVWIGKMRSLIWWIAILAGYLAIFFVLVFVAGPRSPLGRGGMAGIVLGITAVLGLPAQWVFYRRRRLKRIEAHSEWVNDSVPGIAPGLELPILGRQLQ